MLDEDEGGGGVICRYVSLGADQSERAMSRRETKAGIALSMALSGIAPLFHNRRPEGSPFQYQRLIAE